MKYIFIILTCFFSFLHSSNINNTGYWEGKDVEDNHSYDTILSMGLVEFLKSENAESVADFGCGLGDYVKALNAAGIPAEGFDGNPYTPELSDGYGYVQDLSLPFTLNRQYDWVISLEVGEHIPYRFETNFIENLVRHGKKGIILSWAIKGQGGYGHVNCRNNPYIKKKMESYGLVNDVKAEKYLRKNSFFPWFKNTIMVFRFPIDSKRK